MKVKIGGKHATLINVNNEGLYCFVPQGAYKGNIEVTVGDEQQGNQQTATAADNFEYERKMVVGTLCGYRNERDDQGWRDGSFETVAGATTASSATTLSTITTSMCAMTAASAYSSLTLRRSR